MDKIRLPGVAIVALGAVCTALINFYSIGGAGAEWLYAPIAVAVLGTLGAIVNANKPPVEASAAASRGSVGEPVEPVAQPETKWRKFFLG